VGGAEGEAKRATLTYQQGLDVAKKIQALRYLGKQQALRLR